MENFYLPEFLSTDEENYNLTNKEFAQDVIQNIQTIDDMIRWVHSYFLMSNIYHGHGYLDSLSEANELVYSAININYFQDNKPGKCNLTAAEKTKILSWAYLRVHNFIPLAYLTNHICFYGSIYYVDQRTIIPRSPIGELIDKKFVGLLNESPRHILDLCTGSGVLAIFAAQKFTEAQVDGVDISVDALDVADINLSNHPELIDRVALIESDLFNNIPKDTKYSLIISNPPYVDKDDYETMPDEYSHEPKIALVSGDDGLNIVRRIFDQAADYLEPKGVLICEVGNSMLSLQANLNIELQWLEFENGGEGVFLITREQLVANREAIDLFIAEVSPEDLDLNKQDSSHIQSSHE